MTALRISSVRRDGRYALARARAYADMAAAYACLPPFLRWALRAEGEDSRKKLTALSSGLSKEAIFASTWLEAFAASRRATRQNDVKDTLPSAPLTPPIMSSWITLPMLWKEPSGRWLLRRNSVAPTKTWLSTKEKALAWAKDFKTKAVSHVEPESSLSPKAEKLPSGWR